MADEPFTAEVFATWYTPREALAIAMRSLPGSTEADAGRILDRKVRGCLIMAAVASSARTKRNDAPTPTTRPTILGPSLWPNYSERHSNFWDGAPVFMWFGTNSAGQVATDETLRGFGMRLSRADVDAQFLAPADAATPAAESSPAPAPSVATAVSRRGAPRAAFWDDLLIEMFRRIYANELKPQRQADIERAMLEWADANSIDVSEASVRPRAAKLWKMLSEEG